MPFLRPIGRSFAVKYKERYKLIVLGGALLLLAFLVTRGDDSQSSRPDLERALRPVAAVPASGTGEASTPPKKPHRAPRRDDAKEKEQVAEPEPAGEDAPAGEEAPVDSAEIDAPEVEFDEEEARGIALSKVQDFNRALVAELRTVNPNARKARLKASQLKEKASELDAWIKAQDGATDMTPEERMEWQAQRQVWLDHAKELRQVSQRLSATRGTKRKVRILAKEISDSLND
jgi:hypothetical protein